MARPSPLGGFEHVVLLAVMEIGADAYAVPVRALIEERTGRPVSRGALYTTLERLEAKAYLRSRMGDPTPVRGGRPKRYFSVTAAGQRALRETQHLLTRSWRGFDPLAGGAS